jgi:hypothetical protein
LKSLEKFLQLFRQTTSAKGGEENVVRRKKSGCQRPDELKGKPEECTPKQIKNAMGQ